MTMRLGAVILALLATASIASGQQLYLSDTPNSCCPVGVTSPNHYRVYAHSAGGENFSTAEFRIETGAFDAEDIEFVNPMPGVVVVSGDIFSGITVTWPSQVPDHLPLIEIKILDSAQPFGEVWVTDATMYGSGGGGVPLDPKLSIIADTCHCNGCLWHIDPPDTADVVVGAVTAVQCLLGAECDGYVAAPFEVTDSQGWVDSWTPTALYLPDQCGECIIGMRPVQVLVLVPEGTPVGAISEVEVADRPPFPVRAVKPVPVTESTFGRVKAMYGDRE
jgi:hypothetical protein